MKKIFITLHLIFMVLPLYAHSPVALDGNGGHRVEDEQIYRGKYIEIRQARQINYMGTFLFIPSTYHFHCFRCSLGMNKNILQDGLYFPYENSEYLFDIYWAKEKEVRYLEENP